MSAFFPHVNLVALKKFAAAAAAAEHPSRSSGRNPKKVDPQVASCKDMVWAGERMILIVFERKSLPLGPHLMLAHFPRGRPRLATQAVVGMTATIRACPIKINAPKVYGYRDFMPNDINAEVVLLEKVPGENLETVWPTLTAYQEMKVCVRLVELLLKLFNYRGSRICTNLEGTGVNNRGASALPTQQQADPQPIYGYPSVLQSRPFTEGPLSSMDPQEALTSTTDYLIALSHRMDRIFTDPAANLAARHSGPPDTPPLTDADISRIRETWHRLGTLIPYHTGGFYIPGTLSTEARRVAYSVLQSKEFGIYHSDMQMSRFIVQIITKDTSGSTERKEGNPGPSTSANANANMNANMNGVQEIDVILTLTGWEHALRAPLWSCARLPLFLTPRPIPHEVFSWERQANLRDLIFFLMNDRRMLPASWEWIVGYVFGVPERWFEGCLGSHWMYRDVVEAGLVRLRKYWEGWRPDIPFPVEVGGRFLHQDSAEVGDGNGLESTALFEESVNALARASGTAAGEWELAQ